MKKNVKRLLAALMSVAMLSAVLGGCGSKTGGETSAGSSSASAGEPMTVRISAGPSGANNFMICAALGDKVMSEFSNYNQ